MGAKGLEGPLRSLEHGKLANAPLGTGPGSGPLRGKGFGSGPAPGRAVSGRPLCNTRLSEGQYQSSLKGE